MPYAFKFDVTIIGSDPASTFSDGDKCIIKAIVEQTAALAVYMLDNAKLTHRLAQLSESESGEPGPEVPMTEEEAKGIAAHAQQWAAARFPGLVIAVTYARLPIS